MQTKIMITLPEIYREYRRTIKQQCNLSLPLIDKLVYMEGMKHVQEIDLVKRLTKEAEGEEE